MQLDAKELDYRLALRILRERVVILFDGVPQQPEFAYIPGPPVPVTVPATPAATEARPALTRRIVSARAWIVPWPGVRADPGGAAVACVRSPR